MEQKHSVAPSPGHDGAPSPRHNGQSGELATVFVVDDDRAFREVMRIMLQENGYAVHIFANGAAFLEAYRPGRKECLLVDAMMPGMSGIELIKHLADEGYKLPAILITGHAVVAMAVQAMKAGAVDFIEKPLGCAGLLSSVQLALDHPRQIPTRSASPETLTLRLANLSLRQRQILELVLAGQRSRDIAANLGISPRTVDNHRAAIMSKTGSGSLPALFRTCMGRRSRRRIAKKAM
jgi:two-component system, chemotaxis family, CheB/CheR fusion protein